MEASADSSIDNSALGDINARVASWVSEQTAFVDSSMFGMEDSPTDSMIAKESPVDPDLRQRDPTGEDEPADDKQQEVGDQEQGKEGRGPADGAAADGGVKDTEQGCKEEAAAEPDVIAAESRVDGQGRQVSLMASESPDSQRAWLGRNPRKVNHKPQLAGLTMELLDDNHMPAIGKKVYESKQASKQKTTLCALPPISQSHPSQNDRSSQATQLGGNDEGTSEAKQENDPQTNLKQRKVKFSRGQPESIPENGETKVFKFPKFDAAQKGKAQVRFVKSAPLEKKVPTRRPKGKPVILSIEDLPSPLVPRPMVFEPFRFVRVDKLKAKKKKAKKGTCDATPQGLGEAVTDGSHTQHEDAPSGGQSASERMASGEATAAAAAAAADEPQPLQGHQQGPPEGEGNKEVAPADDKEDQGGEGSSLSQATGGKTKSAGNKPGLLPNLTAKPSDSDNKKKAMTPQEKKDACMRERFFVKRKSPNYDVLYTRALNPPFNLTIDPEQHEIFINMYGNAPIY